MAYAQQPSYLCIEHPIQCLTRIFDVVLVWNAHWEKLQGKILYYRIKTGCRGQMPRHGDFSKLLCKHSKWIFCIFVTRYNWYSVHSPPELTRLACIPGHVLSSSVREGMSRWSAPAHWSARGLYSLYATIYLCSSVVCGCHFFTPASHQSYVSWVKGYTWNIV